MDVTDLSGQAAAYDRFIAAFPDYLTTGAIDTLRADDYGRLDANGHVYLDYTGGRPVRRVADSRPFRSAGGPRLRQSSLGQPESSTAMTHLVERTRRAVLDWFNANDDYVAVFTANATASLKLVGEAYPFAAGGRALFTFDNHNSVNGMREFARARGARVDYAPLTAPELRIDRRCLLNELADVDRSRANLFAFPAQSNFSGVKHPLDLVAEAQQRGWNVLLDAARSCRPIASTSRPCRPDFVVLSFYKMFGYPTGVGCLLMRRPGARSSYAGPGSPAEPSISRPCRAAPHRLSPGKPALKTAR